MRNKHRFTDEIDIKCPYDNCGKSFSRSITVEYETNQRGDVISHRVT